jgi:CRP-like cAMP-binding protein
MQNIDVVQLLKSTELFRTFTDTGIQIMASIAEAKTIPAGTPLFVENMIGDSMFIVAEGRVRLAVRAADGRDLTLSVLAAPATLGEAAILRSGPRLCSATADVQSAVVEISRRDVAQLQRSKPQAVLKLMMSVVDLVGERMRGVEGELREYLAWRAGM